MTTITLEVPDDLAQAIHPVRDRLPEILALGLECLPPAPANVYRYVFTFLASAPTAQRIANFRPTPDMEERLRTLLQRERNGKLSAAESRELDEYERIEHFIINLKSGCLSRIVNLS